MKKFGVSILIAFVLSVTSIAEAKSVTLQFYHWFGGDAGPVVEQINQLFTEENPDITIEFESANTDQYIPTLQTRLAADDAPDIFGVFPGMKFHPQAAAGYLMDLSDQPWVANLMTGAKLSATYQEKVYTMPVDQNVIGVTYNKKMFADLNLAVPTTWDEFLQVCETLKNAGIVPIALGNKDLWVTQLIPYAMAPSAIYRDTPDWDQQRHEGKVKFANSPWVQMMQDYLDLEKKGYFNPSSLGTTYDQTINLVATDKAAMVVNGNWILPGIKNAAPDIQLGMFPLPYAKAGQKVYVSSAVGTTITIASATKFPEEAKKYLEFWARPDIAALYLTERKAFPVLIGVKPELDPAAAEMLPYIEVGTSPFPDQNWPIGVQDTMFKGIQGVFTGSMTIEQMLQEMDAAWDARAK
jgi:raffinose/stachyose/melibiose transport system substrate-binding protein